MGALLSGIMAGALSGWVFWLFCSLGMLLGMALRKRLPADAGSNADVDGAFGARRAHR